MGFAASQLSRSAWEISVTMPSVASARETSPGSTVSAIACLIASRSSRVRLAGSLAMASATKVFHASEPGRGVCLVMSIFSV